MESEQAKLLEDGTVASRAARARLNRKVTANALYGGITADIEAIPEQILNGNEVLKPRPKRWYVSRAHFGGNGKKR